MDIEIVISYSNDRLCTVTLAKPASGQPIYRIATRVTGIPQSVNAGLREARRIFEAEPWENRTSAGTVQDGTSN